MIPERIPGARREESMEESQELVLTDFLKKKFGRTLVRISEGIPKKNPKENGGIPKRISEGNFLEKIPGRIPSKINVQISRARSELLLCKYIKTYYFATYITSIYFCFYVFEQSSQKIVQNKIA